MKLVAVDIGGTHARFAMASVANGRVTDLDNVSTLRAAEYASFEAAWAAFALSQPEPLPRSAAIAVACPIRGDVLQLTNNPWRIRPDRIGETLGVDAHLLINDFEAVGHAVAQLGSLDLQHVCGPDVPLPRHGITTIVGPGTGLGVAQLFRDDESDHVIASEGGHGDFAPTDPVDDAILADLRSIHGRVSVERIVSGPGLNAVYATLARLDGHEPWLLDDKALWAAALDGSDDRAVSALDRFCLCLGAVAGDLALAHGPTAVVVAGGLGQKLASHLPGSGFAERFVAKGRFQTLMSSVPVKVITHPQPGLFGAAAAFAWEHRK